MWTTKPYRHAVELQELIMNDARDPDLKAGERAMLARAFCDLEETKRRLKMKPLPKSVDTTKLSKQGKRAQPTSTMIFDKESLSPHRPVTAPRPDRGENQRTLLSQEVSSDTDGSGKESQNGEAGVERSPGVEGSSLGDQGGHGEDPT